MKHSDVLAVIVSFNGVHLVPRCAAALRDQVGAIVVADNGSTGETVDILATLERETGVMVERLGGNLGIARAINVGARKARELGYKWLLTMDEDSVADPTMIDAYMRAVAEDPTRVFLAPLRGDVAATHRKDPHPISYAITSGNLVRVDLFDAIGPYENTFFTDCVDFDFSLRARRAGFTIWRVPDAAMAHTVGDVSHSGEVLARFYTQHSPFRRYYQYRGILYLTERHALRFPGFLLKLWLLQALQTALVVFRDPRPGESYRAMVRGVRDYLARRDAPTTVVVR